MTAQLLNSIAIVLVEPQFPGNIGMVCRAMKNMGLSDLRLVSGCNRFDDEAIKFAVSARDLLESARNYESLSDAISDRNLTIATTRRSGKYRQELLTPPQVADAILARPDVKAALVFGREDHGLSTTDLSLCTLQATIPSSEQLGSLNLAQSVLIFCYELFNAGKEYNKMGEIRDLASSQQMEAMFTQMESTLLKIGYLNPQNPEHIMRSLRRIFFRADLDSREVAIVRGLFSQVNWAAESYKGTK